MTDIVERLLSLVPKYEKYVAGKAMADAAEEIERLRAELAAETERCIAVMLEVAARSKWQPDEVEKAIRGEDKT